MALFQGGLDYQALRDMPLSELSILHEEGARVAKAYKAKP